MPTPPTSAPTTPARPSPSSGSAASGSSPDPWTGVYFPHGYEVRFLGKLAGGASTKPDRRGRGSPPFFRDQLDVTLKHCRQRHRRLPYDPEQFRSIWHWMELT